MAGVTVYHTPRPKPYPHTLPGSLVEVAVRVLMVLVTPETSGMAWVQESLTCPETEAVRAVNRTATKAKTSSVRFASRAEAREEMLERTCITSRYEIDLIRFAFD